MRRSLLAFAVFVFTAVATIAACSGDDANTEADDAGIVLRDAGADGAIDSSITDASSSFDAGADSPSHDAGFDAGAPGLVTIHAIDEIPYNGSVPVPGALVVFYDPDGTPHPPLLTDDAGAASTIVSPGSAVTVAMTNDAGYPVLREIVSILSIEPGDDLIANGSQTTYSLSESALVTLDPPNGDGGEGQQSWTIGCDGDYAKLTGASQEFNADQTCIVDGSVNALALSEADPVSAVKASAFALAQNISVADGGAEISNWTWTPAVSANVNVTGTFPADATGIDISAALRSGKVVYAQNQNASSQVADGGIVDPAGLSFGLPPPGFIDNIIYQTYVTGPAGFTNQMASVLTVGAYADGFSVNLSDFPPTLTASTGSFNTTSRVGTFAWSANGPLTNLDGEIVSLDWNVVKTSTYFQYSWTIIAPPGTSLVTPTLTSDLVPDTDLPPESATPTVVIQGIDPFHGYARYRAHYGDYASSDFVTLDPYPTDLVKVRQTASY